MAKKRAAKRTSATRAAARRHFISDGEFHTPQGIIRNIRLDHCFVNHGYQRDECNAQSKQLAADWCWDYVGMLIGFHVGGGYYEICSGQRRLNALRRKYPQGVYEDGTPVMVGVLVTRSKTPYKVFYHLDKPGTRRAPKPDDLFKANLYGGEQMETDIRDILRANGIEIAFEAGKPPVGATKAASAFADLYTAATNKTKFGELIKMLVECFSRPDGEAVEAVALRSDFIKGLASYVGSAGYSAEIICNALYWADMSAADIIQRAKLEVQQNSRSGFAQLDSVRRVFKKLVEEYVKEYGE